MASFKKGLDYFRLETDIEQDKKIQLLEAEFGLKGFAIYLKLLLRIYRDEGYYMEWDKDTRLLFAKSVGESGGLVDEVVHGLVRRGLFSQSVFDRFNVLTSASIQHRYLEAVKRREKVDFDSRFNLIGSNVNNQYRNVNIINQNVNTEEQRREEKSREENNTHTASAGPREEEDSPGDATGVFEDPPTEDEVVEYGNMHGIPPEECKTFFLKYDKENWLKFNKSAGQYLPIKNWRKELAYQHRRGWLKEQSNRNNGKYSTNSNQKTRGDIQAEQLQDFQ